MLIALNPLRSVLLFSILLTAAVGCTEGSEPAENTGQDETVSHTTDEHGTEDGTILILGDSITAGYGVDQTEAFPAILQEKIDSTGLDYRINDAGVSGDTSSGGLSRINWLLQAPVDVFILELGANDGLRGIDLSLTARNLDEILNRVKSKNPEVKILIAGMQVPPNLGSEYTDTFRNIFPELAAKHEATLIPFLLEDVAGIPELNQADRIHPTAKGHRIVGKTVWKYLEPVLHSISG